MTQNMDQQISAALGNAFSPAIPVTEIGVSELPSYFRVSDLAVASVRAAAREAAQALGAHNVEINRRLTLMWFGMTLRPIAWTLPSAWDAIAGDYKAADGWVRLHTNAPHHREAALAVLKCAPDREAVSDTVRDWQKNKIEEAIIAAGGAAAAMHSIEEWRSHPQGRAVEAEPLIDWQENGQGYTAPNLEGLRVLDLTRVLAGPVATRFLAGFGAKVLRIDPPEWNEPSIEPEITLGKHRAGLNLHVMSDRHIFEGLLSNAHVLVHGYRAGALDRLGYSAEQRQRFSPGLIDVSLNAYGWTGPWVERRGFDSLIQMSSGIANEGMIKAQKDRPVPLPVQALDHSTGYLMAAAVLRALRMRREMGISFSARLSLARTAAMLTAAGIGDYKGFGLSETEDDLAASFEATAWGTARRLKFPVRIDGKMPSWTIPAGTLRVDPPSW